MLFIKYIFFHQIQFRLQAVLRFTADYVPKLWAVKRNDLKRNTFSLYIAIQEKVVTLVVVKYIKQTCLLKIII